MRQGCSALGGLRAELLVFGARLLELGQLGLDLLDPRIRRPEDLIVMPGVPVIGVLQPAGSRRPVFRRMLMVGAPTAARPALAAPGARS